MKIELKQSARDEMVIGNLAGNYLKMRMFLASPGLGRM